MAGYTARVTSDPLGWGLEAWMDQWLLPHRTAQLQRLAQSVLSPRHFSLPFRLYGALLGAKFLQIPCDELIAMALDREHEAAVSGNVEHTAINRVMLAGVLLAPGAFGKLPNEPSVVL